MNANNGNNKYSKMRGCLSAYGCISIVVVLASVYMLYRAFCTMTADRDFWMQVAERDKADSVSVDPARGNILSTDGQLLASSLPEYKIYMDFQALTESHRDTLWEQSLDKICQGLHAIFPEQSTAQFRSHLTEGFEKKKRHWPIWPSRIDFNTYTEVRKLPVFDIDRDKENSGKTGFHAEKYNARKRTYGSLASRTIGTMYGAVDSARFGLEMAYDSVLRGQPGIAHKRKILNKKLTIIDTQPVDGSDIVSTIDVDIQDLAERSVLDELRRPEVNGDVGVAIVMEVATGDVKAIVNMERCPDGEYREVRNHAVSDMLEPGSVFKTASIMVALDDGVVDTTYQVDTGSGIWPMYGREMRDHNWRRGGYGMMSLPHTLEVSSNIGVSRIIDRFYHDRPEKFVEGIRRLGLADDLHIPFVIGPSAARIRMPKKDSRGRDYVNWSKTTLPWMSIGYETQVPPISTVTFYNAIANGGKMMQPRFIKQIIRNGEVIDCPPVVLRESICKKKTLDQIQTILHHVVSQGLGKKAGSASFAVAGKTGTAQISKGAAGYKSGQVNYLLSFAGYFPADKPRYSCIVCIQKRGLPASGGGMSGVVFHNIAEGIMAQDIKLSVDDARDANSILLPDVKDGNLIAADYVLSHLGFKVRPDWSGSYTDGNPIWGRTAKDGDKAVRLNSERLPARNRMPDVKGMGARDAVYLIESRGVKVRLTGRGKVTGQSIAPGATVKKGMTCQLTLS